MEQSRIKMQAWYYRELIRQTTEIINRWLDESCAPEDLQSFAGAFPDWVNGTVLTEQWPTSSGRNLEMNISVLAGQLERIAKVDAMMSTDPELAKLSRREAAAIADTSHMPPGEPVLAKRFQLERKEHSPNVVCTSPEIS